MQTINETVSTSTKLLIATAKKDIEYILKISKNYNLNYFEFVPNTNYACEIKSSKKFNSLKIYEDDGTKGSGNLIVVCKLENEKISFDFKENGFEYDNLRMINDLLKNWNDFFNSLDNVISTKIKEQEKISENCEYEY